MSKQAVWPPFDKAHLDNHLGPPPEHVSRLAWNIAAPARCTKPVIAASRGYCFGVGFELSLACDFRLASARCRDDRDLPSQDHRHASRRIKGREACDWGIATDCVPDGELEAATDALISLAIDDRPRGD